MDFDDTLHEVITDIARLLTEKNRAYGNSALEPVSIFSKLPAEERLYCRIDDKLNRLMRGHEYQDEDTVLDLTGYLILLLMLRKQNVLG